MQAPTITLLFTDIEGRTGRWEREGERMAAALARHDAHAKTTFERILDYAWRSESTESSDSRQVGNAAARELLFSYVPGVTLGEKLATRVAPRTMLLLLDRCRHFNDGCVRLAEELLLTAPSHRGMVTSRKPLRIIGEQGSFLQQTSPQDPALQVAADHAATIQA